MDDRIKRYIGLLEAQDATGVRVRRGTAFCIGGRYALTAFHNVGDREAWLASASVSLFPSLRFALGGNAARAQNAAVVGDAFDADADWALLEIEGPELQTAAPPCAEIDAALQRPRFTTWGFPVVADAAGTGITLSGEVQDAEARYQQGAWAYQLLFDGAGGTAPSLAGLSGAPCVVDGAIVGIMRANLVRAREGGIDMVLGTGWACPLATPGLLRKCAAVPLRMDPIPGLPGLPPHDLPADPFRYPEWFGENDAEVFFGRNGKIREIYQAATKSDSPRVVLVYGASGVGKSSLLEAGVLPRLRAHYDVLTHRLEAGRSVTATLQALITAAPAAASEGRSRVVMLDQLEEVFSGAGANGDRALRDAAEFIAKALASPGAPSRIVLGFRGERLPQVAERMRERGIAYTPCIVERMSASETEEVVRGIASTRRLRTFYGVEVDATLPQMISADVLKDPQSPATPLLSIILTKLWSHARAQPAGKRRLDAHVYRDDMRARISIRAFLEEQMALVAADCPLAYEAGLADDMLYQHTTAEGNAGQMTRAERGATYPELHAGAGVDQRETGADVLNALIRHRLLYRVPGADDEATRIWHDTLAREIQRRYQRSMKWGQRARRVLEARAREVAGANGTPPALDGHDLGVVRRGLKGMRALSRVERRIVEESENLASRTHLKQWLMGGLGILALVAVVFAGVARRNETAGQAQRLAAGGAAALSEREFRSAQLLLAQAVLLDDQPAYREALLEARLRSPARVSLTALPAGCTRLLALRADGSAAVCLRMLPQGKSAHVGLAIYGLDGQGSPLRSLVTTVNASDQEKVRAEFGPDGALAVFGSDGMEFFAAPLDAAAAGVRAPLLSHVRRAAVCGHTTHLVAFVVDGQAVQVWSEANGKVEAVGNVREVSALALEANCARMAVALEGIEVESWQNSAGQWRLASTFTRHRDVARSVAFGPDDLVASAGTDATLRFWNSASAAEQGYVAGRADYGFVAFSADGRRVLSKSYDQRVQVWERASGRLLATLREFDDRRGQVVTRTDLGSREGGFVGRDSSTVFFRNSASEVEVWRLDNQAEGFVLHESGTVGALAFHPTQHLLASAGDDAPESKQPQRQRTSRVRYWDLDKRTPLPAFEPASAPLVSLWFAAQGRRLVAADASNKVTLWDVATRQPVQPVTPLPRSGWALALADPAPASGDWLVTANPDMLGLEIVDLATGTSLRKLSAAELDDPQGDGTPISATMLLRGRGSPGEGSRRDLLVAANKRVSFIDIGADQQRLLLRQDVGRGVYGLAYDPHTQLVAVGSSNRTVLLFDVGQPQRGIRALEPLRWHHDGGISSLTFCGGWLMSAGNDGVVRLTEAAAPQHSIPLRVHDAPAWWISCNADQTLAASGSTDGTLRVFDLQRIRAMLERPAAALVAEAEAASGLMLVNERITRSR